MSFVLNYIASKFTNPACKIRVVGYFPILGKNYSDRDIVELRMAVGLPSAHLVERMEDPRDLAVYFWKRSDELLRKSVSETDDRRMVFVKFGFSEENALFAKHQLLRAPSLGGPNPYPVDDQVYAARIKVCDKYPQDLEERFQCPIASLGHPIEEGAKTYAKSILETL